MATLDKITAGQLLNKTEIAEASAITGYIDDRINEINWDKVSCDSNLTVTYKFGRYTPDSSTGTKEILCNRKSIKWLFNDAFSEDKDPSVDYPQYTFTCTGSTNLTGEVGSTYTVGPIQFKYINPGKYEFGPDTGCVVEAGQVKISIVDYPTLSNSTTITTKSGENTLIYGELTGNKYSDDAKQFKYTLTRAHTEGTIPKTALGKDCPNKRISSDMWGSTATIVQLTANGYRNMFAGSNTEISVINSATIRALTSKVKTQVCQAEGVKKGQGVFNAGIVENAKQILIAVPEGYRVTEILDKNAQGTSVMPSFTSYTVTVYGATEGADGKIYNVYEFKPKVDLSENEYGITVIKSN